MPHEQVETRFEVRDQQEMLGILGKNDEFLRIMQAGVSCVLVARGNVISATGTEETVNMATQVIEELLFLYRQGLPLTTHDVRYSMRMVAEGRKAGKSA